MQLHQSAMRSRYRQMMSVYKATEMAAGDSRAGAVPGPHCWVSRLAAGGSYPALQDPVAPAGPLAAPMASLVPLFPEEFTPAECSALLACWDFLDAAVRLNHFKSATCYVCVYALQARPSP